MSKDELHELGESIKNYGLKSHLKLHKGKLLDGRNRLEAMELVGVVPVNWNDDVAEFACPFDHLDEQVDPYDYVIAVNLHRRHLTSEQKRELIAKVLKAKPEASNAVIGKQTKTTDKTVAKVRHKLEATSEIPKLKNRIGADGKRRKPRAARPRKAAALEPAKHHATGSAEISLEQRRAENALLDQPAEETVDEVDRRVSCVTNTILDCVDGLSHSDTERFFAALRDRIDDTERKVLQDAVHADPPTDLSIPAHLRRVSP